MHVLMGESSILSLPLQFQDDVRRKGDRSWLLSCGFQAPSRPPDLFSVVGHFFIRRPALDVISHNTIFLAWSRNWRRLAAATLGCTEKSRPTRGSSYALNASATAPGFSAATFRRARAGPSGVRRPCSQLRRVATLTPIMRANSDCDLSSLMRIALMSAGSII